MWAGLKVNTLTFILAGSLAGSFFGYSTEKGRLSDQFISTSNVKASSFSQIFLRFKSIPRNL